jgi:uncharacterized membrane protein
MSWLRFLMLLALIVWIGGIIFFAFVVAPAAFTVLPNPDLAGRVVSRSLTALHWMGLVAGVIFLLCSFTYNRIKDANQRLFSGAHWLIGVMLMLTAISQFGVTPAMRRSRAMLTGDKGQRVELTEQDSETQRRFDRLHAWSVRIEGGVLVLGIVVVGLTAKEFQH